MRKFLLLLSIVCCAVSGGYAQTEEGSSFLFDEYQDAVIIMRNGMQVAGKMNYHLLSEKFYFLDDKDEMKAKILSNADEVNIIKFGDRIFFPEKDAGVEILSSEPLLYVQYKGSARDKPKAGGYGGVSAVSNIKTYSVGNTSGNISVVPNGIELELGKRYNVYWIERKGKKKEIRNMKQFLKLNSAHKDELEKYIKEKEVDFSDARQMLELCLYADSISK